MEWANQLVEKFSANTNLPALEVVPSLEDIAAANSSPSMDSEDSVVRIGAAELQRFEAEDEIVAKISQHFGHYGVNPRTGKINARGGRQEDESFRLHAHCAVTAHRKGCLRIAEQLNALEQVATQRVAARLLMKQYEEALREALNLRDMQLGFAVLGYLLRLVSYLKLR